MVWSSQSSHSPSLISPNSELVLSRNGGWCWFQNPRAIVWGDQLVVGSVSLGRWKAPWNGNVEATIHNLSTGRTKRVCLHRRIGRDDHSAPAFLRRADGRLSAFYTRHGSENFIYHRVSKRGDAAAWSAAWKISSSPTACVCYTNPFLLSAEGRMYNFFRGADGTAKPSFVYSDDHGESWSKGKVLIDFPSPSRHRPYVRYASKNRDTIHLIYSEGHPRDHNNSIFHCFYREGSLHSSDGRALSPLSPGLKDPNHGTKVYQGGATNSAWPIDLLVSESGEPVAIFSVSVSDSSAPGCLGDIRYFYARLNGQRWTVTPLAFAGTGLYEEEEHYSGLATFDPGDSNVVFISTNADPTTGEPLISAIDGKRHYELFCGQTANAGETWNWTPLTQNSIADNLRPIALRWRDRPLLLWLRGSYRSYIDYQQQIILSSLPISRGCP